MYVHQFAENFNRFFRFISDIGVLGQKLLTQLVHHLDEWEEHRDYD